MKLKIEFKIIFIANSSLFYFLCFYHSLHEIQKINSKGWVLHGKLNRRLHKPKLLPNIIPFSLKILRKHPLNLIQPLNRIRQLYLPTCTLLLLFQKHKNFWGKNIPSHNRKIRRCCTLCRFLYKIFNFISSSFLNRRVNNPISMRFLIRNRLNTNNRGTSFFIYIHKLFQTRCLTLNNVIP